MLDLLATFDPALGNPEFIPAFADFRFDGKTVLAYNDQIGMQAPCDLDIQGGVRGTALLRFLRASNARDVHVEQTSNTEVVFKLGRAKLRLPLRPLAEFTFTMPGEDDYIPLPVTKQLPLALKQALTSVGVDPSATARFGVTWELRKDCLVLYSSDNVSVATVVLDQKIPEGLDGVAVILQASFCAVLSGIVSSCERVLLSDESMQVVFADGLRLFARTIAGANPEMFATVLLAHDCDDLQVVSQNRLTKALDRARVVFTASNETASTLSIKGDGRLHLFTKGAVGEVEDSIPFTQEEKVVVEVEPRLILRALPFVTKMKVTKPALILESEDGTFRHLISTVIPGE